MNAAVKPTASASMPSSLSGAADRRPRGDELQARASPRDPRRRQAARLLRSPCRELHGRGRTAASRAGSHPARPSGVAAWRLHVDRRTSSRSTGRIWSVSAISSNAMSRRWSPSISPGRRTRPPTSTISCRCPTPRRHLPGSAITSTRCRTAIGRPMLLENPSTYVAFREFDDERDGFHPRDRRAHRMRLAARHQQRLRIRHQSRLLGA